LEESYPTCWRHVSPHRHRLTAWICANEIDRPLHRGKGTRTSKADDRRSLQVVAEAHVRDETTAHIRTHVACARADG